MRPIKLTKTVLDEVADRKGTSLQKSEANVDALVIDPTLNSEVLKAINADVDEIRDRLPVEDTEVIKQLQQDVASLKSSQPKLTKAVDRRLGESAKP